MRPLTQTTFETTRLTLRPLGEDDIPALFAMFSDPEVTRYWSTPTWQDASPARDMLDHGRKMMETGEHLLLGIALKDGGDLVGTVHLFDFKWQCRRAEIGYNLIRSAWGQGYMQEALTALVVFAFTELDLLRLEADIDPRNTASARTLERLGFIKEGHLRARWLIGGELSDSSLYGLLRTDWDTAAAKAGTTGGASNSGNSGNSGNAGSTDSADSADSADKQDKPDKPDKPDNPAGQGAAPGIGA